MSLISYPFQDVNHCPKCGAGAQRHGPGAKGWDPVTESLHMVCWSCRYEYLMEPAQSVKKWWKFW